MSKKTELTKKEETALAVSDAQGAWGTENVDAKDVIIPRIHLAQKMTECIGENGIAPGVYYNGQTQEVMGKEKIEVIPIYSFKNWIIEKKQGDRYVYDRTEAYDPGDANKEWDFEENGEIKRRNETLNFFFISPEDLKKAKAEEEKLEAGEEPDTFTEVLPYLMSFRRTAYRCGKEISMHMLLMKRRRAPAAAFVIELGQKAEKNDNGTFYVPTFKKGRRTTAEELEICKAWYDQVCTQKVKVQEETPEPEVENTPLETESDDAQF